MLALFSVAINLSVLHDEIHPLHFPNVDCGIAGDGDDIGKLALLDRSTRSPPPMFSAVTEVGGALARASCRTRPVRELDSFYTMIRAFLRNASVSCVDREGNFCAILVLEQFAGKMRSSAGAG
jgi:hypothetical protein